MKLTAITFDRVFDVQRRSSEAGIWTEFGFESEGRKTYGVSVFGHPVIPIGQPLLAAVDAGPAWRKIYGWKNLASGDLVTQPERSTFISFCVIGAAFVLATVPLWLLNYPHTTPGVRAITGVVQLGTVLYVAGAIRYQWRLMAAHEMLSSATLAD